MEHYSYRTFVSEFNILTFKYQSIDNPNSKENIKDYRKEVKKLNERYLKCCKRRNKRGYCDGEKPCRHVLKCFENKFKEQ